MNKSMNIQELIRHVDKIYVDTSSLMNIIEFEMTLKRIERFLMQEDKKIHVCYEVILELLRHKHFGNQDQADKSSKALDLIRNNSLLFIMDMNGKTQVQRCEVMAAFADNQLLSIMTKGVKQYNQLLITNDKSLAVDAYRINNLESCNGKPIQVCYISPNGYLNRCNLENQGRNTEDDYTITELFHMSMNKIKKMFINQ